MTVRVELTVVVADSRLDDDDEGPSSTWSNVVDVSAARSLFTVTVFAA